MLYNYIVGHSIMYFVSQNKTFQYFKPSLGIKNPKTHRLQDEGTTRLKMQTDFWVLGLIAAALYEKIRGSDFYILPWDPCLVCMKFQINPSDSLTDSLRRRTLPYASVAKIRR